jgi:hypothetical protein|tara:strand:+ start:890 stop:1261 length:372 start_codon:yes stop_codon:yes gene_type:complete
MKDPNHLIKVEKAILDKYGEEAIQNPKANWDEEKEKEYLKQIKKIAKSRRPKEKVEVDGILMPKKLFNKESKRTCPSCKTYSFEMKDDLYMAKFKCCYKCYVQYVEDREEKWFKKLNLEQEEQ